MQPLPVVAVINQKGGAGKTTLAVHLAVAAAEAGETPVIFDADPQRSAVTWSTQRANAAGLVGPKVVGKDHVTPAMLEAEAAAGASLAILDGAPRLELAAAKLVRLADLVLVPCRPAAFDLAAVEATATLIRAAGKPALFVLNAAPTNTRRPTDDMREALADFGYPVCELVLHQRVAYADAVAGGQAVTEADPKGRAAAEIRELFNQVRERIRK